MFGWRPTWTLYKLYETLALKEGCMIALIMVEGAFGAASGKMH